MQPDGDTASTPRLAPMKRDALGLPTRFATPESELEKTIASIWRKALNVDEVGLNDDFFDLGGDSLTAATIAAAVSAEFSTGFKPGLLMTRGTVAAMASYFAGEVGISVAKTRNAELPLHIEPVRTDGDLRPIFFIPGILGITFPGPDFMASFDPRQPIYVVRAIGYMDGAKPLENAEDLASHYLECIRAVQPRGPFNLVGMCAGGMIALEITHQLADEGEKVGALVIVDPPDPAMMKAGRVPMWLRPALFRCKFFSKRIRHAIRRNKPGRRVPINTRDAETAEEMLDEWLLRHPEQSNSDTSSFFTTFEKTKLAIWNYMPRPYDGPADIVVSEDRAARLDDIDSPWRQLLPEVRIVRAGKTHSSLFAEDAAKTARQVQNSVFRQDPQADSS